MYWMDINLLAVFAAAVAAMIVGFLWYSPLLFARPWMRLMGYSPDDPASREAMRKGAARKYVLSFAASLVSAFVLAKIVDVTTVNTVPYGMKVGFAMWLGFVATVQLTDALFTAKPARLLLINSGHQLACYLAMGAILARWGG